MRKTPTNDNEYTYLMSHPDTHAVYHRAYRLWKAEKDKKEIEVEASTSPTDKEYETDNGYGDKNVVSGEVEDTIENSSQSPRRKDNFWDYISATDTGLHLDPDIKMGIPTPYRTNMYIYSNSNPVKA